MGLQVDYDCYSGGYMGFMRFREWLAQIVGLPDLRSMEGFQDFDPKEKGHLWDEYRSDPVCLLLDHSDCEGELTLEECKRLLPRLRQISVALDTLYLVPKLSNNEDLLDQWIEGLASAIGDESGVTFH